MKEESKNKLDESIKNLSLGEIELMTEYYEFIYSTYDVSEKIRELSEYLREICEKKKKVKSQTD